MDGTTQTQSSLIGLGLILAVMCVCLVAMGQDKKTKVDQFIEKHEWLAFPHENGELIYYVRVDHIIGIVEASKEAQPSFSATEVMLTNGKVIHSNLEIEEFFRRAERSKPTAEAARKAYLSSEKGGK